MDKQLEPCTSIGKGWRWRGCAGAGPGGLQGSPRTLLGSGGSSQNSSGSGDIFMASHPHGTTSLCTAGTHGENVELLTKRKSENKHVGQTFPGFEFCKQAKNQCWQVSISAEVEKGLLAESFGKRERRKKLYFPLQDSQGFVPSKRLGVPSSVEKPRCLNLPGLGGRAGMSWENHLAPGMEQLAGPPCPPARALAPPDKGQLVSWCCRTWRSRSETREGCPGRHRSL